MDAPEHFDFPFPPYDIQHNFMQNLYYALESKKLGIFESPTGTGKSLSIICGAIKWLKDHNDFIRNQLLEKIQSLEKDKQNIATESTDWISSQSKEIDISHAINLLKIEQTRINDYDQKMENLKKLKETKYDKRKKKPYVSQLKLIDKNSKQEEIDVDSEEIIDDDELLLEENVNGEDDDLSDEEDEDKYRPLKIYICSRTHSQLSQFVGEIIKSPFSKNIRVVSLASRQTYCINPEVSKLKNMALINEKCIDMQKKPNSCKKNVDEDGKITKKQKNNNCRCPFYKQTAIEELKDWTLLEVLDVEDLVNSAKELNACPYYSSRKAAEDAEVVLVPYNTILHKATREANGIRLKDNIVIIDEAHNLLEALAQMYNADLNYAQLYHALHQLKSYKNKYSTRFSAPNLLCINQLIFVVNKLFQMLDQNSAKSEIFTVENFVLTAHIDNYNMFKLVNFCKDSRIAQKIRSFAIKNPVEENILIKQEKKGVKDFLASIENKKGNEVQTKSVNKETISIPPVSNPLLAVISFLSALTYSYEDGRILLTQDTDKLQRKLQFLLLNPSSNFSDIVNEARSVIVAGGTMKPIAEFKERLFINAGASVDRIMEFSCDHIIPPENILPIIVTKGCKDENLLFNFENRMSMGNNLKSIIHRACNIITGGIVVFFPSYKYENWFCQQIKDFNFGRPLFREPQNSGQVDSVLEKFSAAIKRSQSKGALLFSVVGGKLSEGLNFSDDLGRCVIVVGLPYANIMAADLKEKMRYLDKKEGIGAGQKFYENMCMKSVNQCIGRAVRHRNDYATVLLVDERYNRTSVKNALPNWIKRSLKVFNYEETFSKIKMFFEEKEKQK